MKPANSSPFANPKAAQRIARRSGQREAQTVAVRMIGRKDVDSLIAGILQAQKSSRKMKMVLD
jgi:hypothetical protein